MSVRKVKAFKLAPGDVVPDDFDPSKVIYKRMRPIPRHPQMIDEVVFWTIVYDDEETR